MPNFRKIERAKTIIQDGEKLDLKECAKCKAEFYGNPDQTKCEACRGRKRKAKS
jgi:hypothetical protein